MQHKVLYENDDVLVVDKPAGLSVHPGNAGDTEKTLIDLIKDKVEDPDPERPGIVHRLDKDTSGVMIIARTVLAKKALQSQFKTRKATKVYWVLVEGRPQHPVANIEVPIGRHTKNPLKRAVRPGGKPAKTTYKVLQTYGRYSLIEAKPQTGRTHQIRVHLAYIGHPVVGDRLYGKPQPQLQRHWLHAQQLTLQLPSGETKTFISPLPNELKLFLTGILNSNGSSSGS